MKFWNAGDCIDLKKCGCILIDEAGNIHVAEHYEIAAMMNRLAPDSRRYRTDTLKCLSCDEVWCEIYLKSQTQVQCPECNVVFTLLENENEP